MESEHSDEEKLYNGKEAGKESCENLESEEREIMNKLKFKDSEVESKDPSEVEVYVFGDVELNENETNILRKRPEWAIPDKLSRMQMEIEIETIYNFV